MRADWRKAAITGDRAAIDTLLGEGVDIDGRDRYGQTALMLSARHGREELVRLLISRNAGTDLTAKYGLSALMLAVINRHAGVARLLVDAGADVLLRGNGAPGFAGKSARELAENAGLSDVAAYIAQFEQNTRRG